MDGNDLTAEEKELLTRNSRDPVAWEALELLAPINQDAQTALRVAVALEHAINSKRAQVRMLGGLREALSQPGAMKRLRALRDDPVARDLLWVAERLGIEG
jgi:hypothetical protein